MIKVNNLNKYFNKNRQNEIHVLNQVSLDFPEKGLVILLGPSGSGKTTLLNVISGLDKVDSGVIDFEDKNIKKYSSKVWDSIRNQDVGYIFQNYYLLNELTVFDNVAFVLKMIGIEDQKEIEQRVNYILEQVGMYKYRKKKALHLSGGQQQRVAIARALVKNPKVIIADEPTGNLDSKNTIDVMNIIKSISLTKLVVLVTHEKELADIYSDRVIEFKDGKIEKDYLNDGSSNTQYNQDNTVYLKDLKSLYKNNDDNNQFEVYTDEDEITKNKIRLIIKNKTLYIDVNSSIKKISLVDEKSHISILDEHYKTKSKEELLETKFNLEKLEHKDIKKSKKALVDIKTSIWMAFKKLLTFGRKGKFMLFIFALSGIFIAISSSMFMTTLQKSYVDKLVSNQKYLNISNGELQEITNVNDFYNDLNTFMESDFNILIDQATFDSELKVSLGENRTSNLALELKYEISGHLDPKEIIYGKNSTNENEVLVSKGFFNYFTPTQKLSSLGIYEISKLVGEKLVLFNDSKEYTIVGITNYNSNILYLNDQKSYGLAVHKHEETKDKMEKDFLNRKDDLNMYANNIEKLKTFLNSKDIKYSTHYDIALKIINREKNILFGNNYIIYIVLISISLVAFFFVMRSSMMQRIYEISVFRALGVNKKEVFNSFAIEIVLLTTVSSFIGFVFTNIIISVVGNTPLNALVDFKVSFLSFTVGFVLLYVSNLVVGLLPMYFLLRKTPAQIITKYDM